MEPGLLLAQPSFHSTLAAILRKRPRCHSSKGTGDTCQVKGWADLRPKLPHSQQFAGKTADGRLQQVEPQVSLLFSQPRLQNREALEGAGAKTHSWASPKCPRVAARARDSSPGAGSGWPGAKAKDQGTCVVRSPDCCRRGRLPHAPRSLLATSSTFYTWSSLKAERH